MEKIQIDNKYKSQENQINILDLPDIFMISVFRLFNIKDRLKFANVCKKWNQLVKDCSLWIKIDLREYKNDLNLSTLKNLIKIYGSDSSKEFMLSGSLNHDYTSNFRNLNLITSLTHSENDDRLNCLDKIFFTDHLSMKCKFLDTIILEYIDLSKTCFNLFQSFRYLKKFSLKWCNINQNWFDSENENENEHLQFTNIKQLYLIRSGKLNANDIENICKKMPYLDTLSINQAQSSVTDDSVEYIVRHLAKLEQLELTNTLISDKAIFKICNSPYLCKNLKHLNLSMSSCLTNNCLLSIAENLLNLKSLYLTSCFGISNVKLLQNFINLNYLNLNNTSIDREKIRELLLPILPNCEIEFGHEKMLNRKLMWTINGSRNCVCSF